MKSLLIIGIIAGIVLLIVQFPHTMLSPGDLVQGHQKLKNDCFACHAPFGGIANDQCIACHQLSEIGKDTANLNGTVSGKAKILFHQNLSSQSCMACHTDHDGINAKMPFNGFKHTLLAETVINNCVSCHAKPTDKLHGQLTSTCKSCHNTDGWKGVKFNHDMLAAADKNNCASCHQSPSDHLHASLKGNCNKCHSSDQWTPSSFDHSTYFILDRNHDASCNTCHKNGSYDTYTCYGCHEHTVSNILGEHNEEGIYNITNCVSCHKSGDEGEGESERNYNGENNRKNRKEEKEDDDD